MRFSRLPSPTFLLTSFLTLPTFTTANPYPRLASENPTLELAHALELRACATPCGYYGQVCCSSGQYCYTDTNDQASCGTGAASAGGAGGAGWTYWTTTLVVSEVDVITTVYSSQNAVAANTQNVVTVTVAAGGATGSAPTCNIQLGQTLCGNTCCTSGQFCNAPNVCIDNGASTQFAMSTATITAAIRPTSISTFTVLTTGSVTTTVPFLLPATATASGSGNGTIVSSSTSGTSLSGGAIAGIVIGVLLGIILLILLIICCCARGLLDLFRPKRKTEVTEVYEARHHSGGAGAPPPRRGRFGGMFGGGRNNNQGGGGGGGRTGFLGVAGVLAALALLLGLKRRSDRKASEKASTVYTYSDYTYDYSTSASSESSDDRRSRATRSHRGSSRR